MYYSPSYFITLYLLLGFMLRHYQIFLEEQRNLNNEMGSLITKSLAHLLDHPHDGASLN
jgi:hypothetical protein